MFDGYAVLVLLRRTRHAEVVDGHRRQVAEWSVTVGEEDTPRSRPVALARLAHPVVGVARRVVAVPLRADVAVGGVLGSTPPPSVSGVGSAGAGGARCVVTGSVP